MTVSSHDRGFQFGDGVFETIRIEQGQLQAWDFHAKRFSEGAARLGIRLPAQRLLKMRCQSQAAAVKADVAILKLQITRGDSGGGYAAAEAMAANLYVSVRPLRFDPALWQTGIKLRVCAQRLAIQPSLAGIKHCNRLEQVMARREWSDPETHEGLMLDMEGYVIEGVSSNVFAFIDGQWFTPPLDRCGVAGTMRAQVLEWFAARGAPVTEQRLTLERLATADHLFMTNAIVGVWPVGHLAERPLAIADVMPELIGQFSNFVSGNASK